jgi:hypothetical protein
VEQDPLVKLVLQAFQMSLSCCMERTEVPMMQRQLLLRMQGAARRVPEAQVGGRLGVSSVASSCGALVVRPSETACLLHCMLLLGGGAPA